MSQEELYAFLTRTFEPLERGLDPERQVALDGLIESASRQLACPCESFAVAHKTKQVWRAGF